jgi:hypothetical protein
MKKIYYWVGLCAIIFIIGLLGSFILLKTPQGARVNIVQNGNVLYSLDLSKTDDKTIEVVYEGRTNTIEIKEQQIRMLDAECPDHTCIRMGYLTSITFPVVCLPNRLVIQFTNDNDVDAVAQ